MKRKNKKIKIDGRLSYLIPIAWTTGGIIYARSIEGFAAIGIGILFLVSGVSMFSGILTWRITGKWYYGIAGFIATNILLFLLLRYA